jgi:hypothetical protein
VDDAGLVDRGQPARELQAELEHPRPAHRGLEVVQRLAGDQLVGQVGAAVDLADPVDMDDVGVLQAGQEPRLGVEGVARPAIERLAGDELERHRPVEEALVAEVDLPHAAASELPDDTEAVERRRRNPARRR